MELLKDVLIIYFVVINLVALAMYVSDKQSARKNQWRIPESTLLGVAIAGGSVGAFFGMQVFRHKTKHWKFKILVPLFLIFHIFILFVILFPR